METLRVHRWRPSITHSMYLTSSPASTTDQNLCNCKYFLLILKKPKNKKKQKKKKKKVYKDTCFFKLPPLDRTLWFLFNINTICVLLAPGATYLIDNNNSTLTKRVPNQALKNLHTLNLKLEKPRFVSFGFCSPCTSTTGPLAAISLRLPPFHNSGFSNSNHRYPHSSLSIHSGKLSGTVDWRIRWAWTSTTC